MLAIRMQRTGRSGHSQFRVIVQDARSHPKSGRIVEYLGSYNPHTKVASIKTDKIKQYMQNGAQPSETIVKLLKKEGVKVPAWAVSESKKKKAIKNPEKLRRNRPAGEPTPEPAKSADEQIQEGEPAPSAEPAAEAENEPVSKEAEPQADAASAPEQTTAAEESADPVQQKLDEPVAADVEPEQPAEASVEGPANSEKAENSEPDQKTS